MTSALADPSAAIRSAPGPAGAPSPDALAGNREGVFLGALLAATVLLYGGTLFGSFVWDDDTVVFPAASRSLAAVVGQAFSQGVVVEGVALGYFRPLVALSYALDGSLWGRRPFGFHLTNLVLFLLCVALASRLARRLLGPGVAAAAAAVAFALHPVHVEPVAWVQGRGDLLAFVAVATSLLAFLRSLEAERAWPWCVAAGAASLAGTLAKEWAVVAPALAATCWAFAPRRDRAAGVHAAAALAPFAVALAAYGALRIGIQGWAVGGTAAAHLPMGDRWLILTPTFTRYVRLLLWPHPLSAYHVVPVPAGLGEFHVVGGALLLGFILGTAAWAARQAPRLALALWWFLLTLVFVLPLWPIKGFTMAERYLFLPSFGFALAVGLLAEQAWRSLVTRPARLALGATGAAVALVWGGLASARVPDWVDAIEFYRAMLRTAPNFAIAQTNLGALLVAGGSVDEGMQHLEHALRIRTDIPETYWHLGTAHRNRGDLSRAADALETAARLRPTEPRILEDLGGVLIALGRPQEALTILHRWEGLQPDSPEVARRLAEAYASVGDMPCSVHYATRADRLSGRMSGPAGNSPCTHAKVSLNAPHRAPAPIPAAK